MICEKIIGRAEQMDLSGKKIEYVEIEWHEAFKKIHRKVTNTGREIGIRLDDEVLKRGLYEGDVLYVDDESVIVVTTPPCEVIAVTFAPDHECMLAKVCYEIGNRHAPMFYGEGPMEFITPYNEPMLVMLRKIHGINAEKTLRKLDFEHRISAAVHNHHH